VNLWSGKWRGSNALAVAAALAASLGVAAPAAATAAARAAAVAVEVCGTGPAVVRPGRMVLACADDGELAEDLHWGNWSAQTASATGNVTWRACRTLCADSTHLDSASADYTLSDPVQVAGQGELFTRLEMHLTGTTPRGFLRDLAFDEAPSTVGAPQVSRQRALPGVQAAASGTLGYAQIEGYWIYAGGPDGSAGSYTDAQVAAAITGAESSFLPGIIQPGVDYCGSGADKAGWGLWQITCGNSVPQYGTDFQVLDPWNNAEEAVYKCVQDMDAGFNCFTPWTTYNDGAYTGFLSSTGPDMAISDPGEYVQINSTPPGTPSSPPPDPGSTYGPPMPNHNTPVPGNLLQNGSFETSASGWSRFIPSGVTVNVSRYEVGHGAPAAAHDGSWYLATNTNGAGGSVYQDVTVNAGAGASYVGTVWLSAQSTTASGSVCVWGLSPSTADCEPYHVSAGAYQQVQLVYDLPAAHSTLRFQIYPAPNGGTTDIDTASLVRNILANGSFESSASGWSRFIPPGVTVNVSRYEVGHGAPAAAHDGSWYLATNTNGAGGSVYQDVTVNAGAGASYVGDVWLSAQSTTASGSVCVWGLSPSTADCEPYHVTAGAYQQVQLVYDLPAAHSTLRFQIYPAPNGGTTDIDTASLG
jgi:hypothetical protein